MDIFRLIDAAQVAVNAAFDTFRAELEDASHTNKGDEAFSLDSRGPDSWKQAVMDVLVGLPPTFRFSDVYRHEERFFEERFPGNKSVPQTIAMALRELVNDKVIEKLDKGRYRRILLGPDDASPDTVVVPAQQGNFEAMFLRDHRWAEIRIDHDHRRDSLKYLAVYQTAPESAITHIAAIKDIRKGQEPGKSELLLGEPEELPRRIELVQGGTIPQLRNIRYTTRARLEAAQTLDDVWKPRSA